jgi:putative transposase
LAQQYDVHPNLINQWRAQLLGAADVFGAGPATSEPAVDIAVLHAKIGELTLANGFGRCARESRSVAECKAMIDRDHALPLARQAQQLDISRGSIYYLLRPVSPADLLIMRQIDELHLLYPFAGSRMLRDLLRQEGVVIGRRHVTTLMKRMGLEAIYRRPNTSKPATGHKIYPYLLRKLAVTRPNQVWAMGITYIPMARGFVYLVAIVDWFTRRVLAWRMSISMMSRSASKRWRRRWHGTASLPFSTRIRAHNSPVRPSRRPAPRRDRHKHGWKGLLARQRVR